MILFLACAGSDGLTIPSETASPTGDTGPPTGTGVSAALGPVVTLTTPPASGLHHHATVAWGLGTFALAFVVNGEPETQVWTQVFDAAGAAVAPPAHLNETSTPRGDKPDVEWDGTRWVVAWDDAAGGVWLTSVDPDGRPAQPVELYANATLDTEAVDLAVGSDGSGVALWTEAGAPTMGPDDGRIVWRAFDASLAADGAPVVAEVSSKKASDAAPRADGGWVGVWAIHYVHPTVQGEFLYEVWGQLVDAAGNAVPFRADDLDEAWPSRPAVAVGPGGELAVGFRDKTASRGDSAGAYARLLTPDAVPIGPSVALGPGNDGDRVVVAFAGDLAVFSWQETVGDRPEVLMSVLGPDGTVLVDRLQVSEAGDLGDERPSITVREVDGAHEVLATWEAFAPGQVAAGIRARIVTLTRP